VQPLGLGAGNLAVHRPMDLESEAGAGASVQARAAAYHRVCSCSFPSAATRGSCLWLCSAAGRLRMESGSFLGPRFHAPTRRDASVSSPPGASCPGAAPRSRWQPARGVWSQHPQLSVLSAPRAVSMARAVHEEAAPGQRAAPSTGHWSRAAPASRDWSRRTHRRACIQLLRHQQVMVQVEAKPTTLAIRSTPLSRAERAHARLSWEKRLARNAHPPGKRQVTIKLCGVPDQFAGFLG
jgi:hypothetical protein